MTHNATPIHVRFLAFPLHVAARVASQWPCSQLPMYPNQREHGIHTVIATPLIEAHLIGYDTTIGCDVCDPLDRTHSA